MLNGTNIVFLKLSRSELINFDYEYRGLSAYLFPVVAPQLSLLQHS